MGLKACHLCQHYDKQAGEKPCDLCYGTPGAPSFEEKTVTKIVIGRFLMLAYCQELIGRHAWFNVCPVNQPDDDEYEVSVKSDNRDIFEKDFPKNWK